ncbi:MAG: alpha-1,2-fucosyltransferase [Paludibacter sp.]|nr:alpha-1,2-fucosyltransferase [Paludibacter sp.]
MIIVNINSGFGNQLFQYAFGYSQSKTLKTFFVVDSYQSFILPEYFNLGVLNSTCLNEIKCIQKARRYLNKRIRAKCCIDFTDCRLSKESLSVNNNSYYIGYFQSISFFEENEDKIKKLFNPRKRHIQEYKKKYELEFRHNRTLVIHIRRTDYLRHGVDKDLGNDDLSLPMTYYRNCLNRIDNLASYRIFVIGDDLAFIQNNFSDLPNVSFEENELIVDFQLLMNADIAIISNSTFAWWAVYLNNNENKRVFAPKYFLGFHVFENFPAEIDYKLPYEWIAPL